MRVAVAMSGGVDSSTAAALLVEQGYDVVGLAMKTHAEAPRGAKACCTPDDMRDARRVADGLGIPFYVLNYEDVFQREIIRPFAEAYTQGLTPNPCVVCNDRVKFRPLLARARLLGAELLATGHYARVVRMADRGSVLLRGVDRRKDQSYFLYRLSAEQLDRLMFPLGGMEKDEVRSHAERFGLPVAHKQESQEICFVGAEGYAATIEKILGHGGRAGEIVGEDGRVLGQHTGVHQFTLGQRRGLGIAAEAPLYVTDIDPGTGRVRVATREFLSADCVELSDVVWTHGPPPADRRVSVQQRYREAPRPARVVTGQGGQVRVVFESPQPRGAPGQAAVIYDRDEVLGGGVIARASQLGEVGPRAEGEARR